MQRFTRSAGAVCAALVLGLVGAAPPAAAHHAEMECTYKLEPMLHKVSGGCSGSTDYGSVAGSFDGVYRPNGSAKGDFRLELGPATTLNGSFKGWSFNGGHAKGTFSAKLGALRLSGAFTASLG